MGVWGWIVLYVLLFSLLQLLLYHRYLRSDEDAALFRSTPPTRELAAVEEIPDFDDRLDGDDLSVVVCPQCGVENETGYTYCRSCVSSITAR